MKDACIRAVGAAAILILMTCGPSVGLGDAGDDPVTQAEFASGGRIVLPGTVGREFIGLWADTSAYVGGGLTYGRVIKTDRRVWVEGFYGSEQYRAAIGYKPSGTIANVNFIERSRVRMSVGVEETFHLTANRYWGFTLGLGVGVQRREYTSKFYPGTCRGQVCSYDRENRIVRDDVDSYAEALARLGIAFRELRVLGLLGDVTVSFDRPLLRWPGELKVRDPDGREHEVISNGLHCGLAFSI